MPLTGFELFANDLTICKQTDGYFCICATSGDNTVRLRVSRATATKLLGVLATHLAEPPKSAKVIGMPAGNGVEESGHS